MTLSFVCELLTQLGVPVGSTWYSVSSDLEMKSLLFIFCLVFAEQDISDIRDPCAFRFSEYQCDNPMVYFQPFKSGTQCGKPTIDCFEWRHPWSPCFQRPDSLPDISAWNEIRYDKFEECTDNCVGFKINDDLKPMFLCSLHFSRYSPTLDPNKNYIGFTFSAVKKGNRWYYNDGTDYNPNKKFM